MEQLYKILFFSLIFTFMACNCDEAEISTLTASEEVIRVLDYNIAYDNDLSNSIVIGSSYNGQSLAYYTLACRAKRLMKLIDTYSPDIVCLQEINCFWWDYLINNETDTLVTRGYSYVGIISCQGNVNGDYKYINYPDGYGRDFYNIIFYNTDKFYLIDEGYLKLFTTTAEYTCKTNYNRICSYAKLESKETGIVAVYGSTHLSTGIASDPQITQTIELATQIEDIGINCSIIVGGDFNSNEDSLVYEQMTDIQGFIDTKYKLCKWEHFVAGGNIAIGRLV